VRLHGFSEREFNNAVKSMQVSLQQQLHSTAGCFQGTGKSVCFDQGGS
jgi:hypothetical protein